MDIHERTWSISALRPRVWVNVKARKFGQILEVLGRRFIKIRDIIRSLHWSKLRSLAISHLYPRNSRDFQQGICRFITDTEVFRSHIKQFVVTNCSKERPGSIVIETLKNIFFSQSHCIKILR